MNIDSRFESFMLSLPSIEGIDLIEMSQECRREKKADYMGMGRQIIFEQKCVTQEQSQRVENELQKYVNDDNYPYFYGERDFNLVIKDLPERESIKKRVFSQITKLLESYLSQASKQIESTKDIFSLIEPVGVLVILNESVKILSPEIVISRLQQRLTEKKEGKLRFPNIDYVIFVSETHVIGGVPTMAVLAGVNASRHPASVYEYLNYIVNSWAYFNGGKAHEINDANEYFNNIKEKVASIPEHVSHSDARRLWYREHRYMKGWSDDKVAQEAALHVDRIKANPKLSKDELFEMVMLFGDFLEESNIRGLDLKELKKYHAL